MLGEAAEIKQRIEQLDAERAMLRKRLHALQEASGDSAATTVTSSPQEKIKLFRCLFRGRTDVFPRRWQNAKNGRKGYSPVCRNEWVQGICKKPLVKCSNCSHQAFVSVEDEIIAQHLRGMSALGSAHGEEFVIGVYPILPDNSCWFLAVDFDGSSWESDARTYLEACRICKIPAALERSRSGNGGHVWIFFSEPIPASTARQLGTLVMTSALDRRPEIGFASYDRFFPNQDTLPAGGFGNLIALPLQGVARKADNTVFVDDDLEPYEDQWAYLSSLDRTSLSMAETLISDTAAEGGLLRVRMPADQDDTIDPWELPPSRKPPKVKITGPVPSAMTITVADQIYIERSDLPSVMVAALVRVAAFQNPEFYQAQAMRLPTYGKPRIISCAELHPQHIALPRGCLDEAVDLLTAYDVQVDLDDKRDVGTAIDVEFTGVLRPQQATAVDAIAAHDFGVLAATTAFGKTVVAAALIARRRMNTLILVHRRELLEQWTERLKTFLSVGDQDIGVIGGGKRKPMGRIDVAMIQSLVRRGEVSDLVAGYGQIIVDECHHLPAVSFELVARRSKARYLLGLSATVVRKDGHHPIIFMQCGPIRHRVDARSQAARRTFEHRAVIKETSFQSAFSIETERPPIAQIYNELANDERRNDLIFDDVLSALEDGRCPIVLTERRQHLDLLADRFRSFVHNLVVLRGGMTIAERKVAQSLINDDDIDERLLLATGRYIGEGFDDPRLDTLFLVMPISWRGTLAQYVGRLHREHDGKSDVVVYDYADVQIPVLARMATKRQAGYRSLGYEMTRDAADCPRLL